MALVAAIAVKAAVELWAQAEQLQAQQVQAGAVARRMQLALLALLVAAEAEVGAAQVHSQVSM